MENHELENEIVELRQKLEETQREAFDLEQVILYVDDEFYNRYDEIVEEMKRRGIWENFDAQ